MNDITLTTPEPPDPTAWGRAVRDRVRRRRRAWVTGGALGAVAAVAVGAIVLPQLTGTAIIGSPAPTPSATLAALEDPCATVPGTPLTTLPTGASSLWLCDAGTTFAPVGVLTTGLDEVVGTLNDTVTAVPEIGISPVRMVLAYPDGRRLALDVDGGGGVTGDFVRQGGQSAVRAVLDRWRSEATLTGSRPWCSLVLEGRPTLSTAPGAVTAGRICAMLSGVRGVAESAPLPEDLVAAIAADLSSATEVTDPAGSLTGRSIRLASPHGELIVLVQYGLEYRFEMGGVLRGWTPSDALQVRVKEATSWPEVPPATPSQGADACPPESGATALPGGHLPMGAETVRACRSDDLSFEPPAEPLTMGVDELAASFNALPLVQGERACTADAGPTYTLVFSWPDGTRHTVSAMLAGCREVRGAGVSRAGADTFLASIRSAWLAQRAARPVDAEPREWCATNGFGGQSPLIPVAVADVTTGVVCRSVPGQAPVHTALSSEAVAAIRGDLVRATTASGGADMTGRSIVLADRSGGTITLSEMSGGVWLWIDQETRGQRMWTPSASVVAELPS